MTQSYLFSSAFCLPFVWYIPCLSWHFLRSSSSAFLKSSGLDWTMRHNESSLSVSILAIGRGGLWYWTRCAPVPSNLLQINPRTSSESESESPGLDRTIRYNKSSLVASIVSTESGGSWYCVRCLYIFSGCLPISTIMSGMTAVLIVESLRLICPLPWLQIILGLTTTIFHHWHSYQVIHVENWHHQHPTDSQANLLKGDIETYSNNWACGWIHWY